MMKRIFSVILIAGLLFSTVNSGLFNITAFAEIFSGTTGDCTWVLEGTVLTISGNGSTDGYASKGEYGDVEYELQPWGREITDVYINEGVTHIGNACFYLCSKLKNITIADDVEYFGSKNFYGCEQLENVYTKDINAWFNISFYDNLSNPLYYADNLFLNRDLVKEIFVPNTVKEIKPYALMYKKLEKITLPDTIIEIGDYAFYNCESIKIVKLPNAIKAINESTFRYCKSLTDIVIPDSVTKIDDYAFAGCSSMKNINISDNVINIGNYALRNCVSLINVNIPKNVTSIGKNVFVGCTELKAINVDKNNKFYTSIDGILYNKDKTHLIACPCAKTGDVIVPDSVLNIDSPNISAIASGNAFGAFVNCNSIQNLVIPNSVKLSECFFFGCQAKNVVLLEGFTTVGQSAFYSSRVSNVTLPKSITKIEANAFNYSNLTDVWYSGNENDRQEIEICNNNTNLLDAQWHYNVCDYNKHIYSSDSDTNCNKCDWVRKICIHNFDNDCDTICNICGETRKIAHTYKITLTKATISKNGKIVKKCSVCGDTKTTIVYYPKTIKLSAVSYTYNGSAKKPTVTVKGYDGKTISSSNYTVKYTDNIKAGTATATVTFKGNYSGTKKLTYKISPASATKATYKLSATTYTYNGKAKSPTVTVKLSGKTLKKNTDYTVNYSDNKSVGKATVKITFKGNYKGIKTASFKINPLKTSVKSLTAGKKSLKVAITKKSTQVTGYQIQYATNKSFKSAKLKNVTSYKTTSATLKGLSAKKTYYVRVRTYKTVKGVKCYSGWSSIKYKKI